MSTIKEVLRLKYLGKQSHRNIELLGLASKSAVSGYITRFEKSKLGIHEALDMEESRLEALLFPEHIPRLKPSSTSKPHPDWSIVHQELKQKGMTRQLLWEEYKAQHPDGLGLTQFKAHYARYAKSLNPSMRQIHYAGDKLFVDFSGLRVPIHNAKTKEVHYAQIFVSVLGSSGYTFVHAVMTQSTEDFITCHNEAFLFYGGVPHCVVPDNLKAAVISNRSGKVILNESYADMGRHYGVAIVPARPYKPQDKSQAELGVKGCQRWILMRLRHRTFFDLHSLNEAIAEWIDTYNAKVIRRLNKSRRELFEEIDAPALLPLRAHRYAYRQHKRYTVRSDYHVEINGSGYSVPFSLVGKRVDVWYSNQSVTISHQGTVIATHPRCLHSHEDSTLLAHMPKQHQYQFEKWHPGRILNWAQTIGPHTVSLMKTIMQSRSHHVRGYRPCMAILGLSKTYGAPALELACAKALELGTQRVSSIESMLKRKTYTEKEREMPANNVFNHHANIRGSDHYQ